MCVGMRQRKNIPNTLTVVPVRAKKTLIGQPVTQRPPPPPISMLSRRMGQLVRGAEKVSVFFARGSAWAVVLLVSNIEMGGCGGRVRLRSQGAFFFARTGLRIRQTPLLRARKIPGVSFSEGPFSVRSFREGFCVSEKFSR